MLVLYLPKGEYTSTERPDGFDTNIVPSPEMAKSAAKPGFKSNEAVFANPPARDGEETIKIAKIKKMAACEAARPKLVDRAQILT